MAEVKPRPEESRATMPSGREMPAIGLGTWQLTGDEANSDIEHALGIGYRMIDTSGDYGNQPQIGEALRSASVPRDQIFLVTKVEEDEDAYSSTEAKLEELGVNQVDLILIHRPPPSGAGEELWDGLLRAKADGLAAEAGVSNYSIEQVDRLAEASGERPAVNQIEWSPFGHSDEVLEHARENGIVIQAYSPLTRTERLGDPTLRGIGDRHGKTPAQVLLRWCIRAGTVPLPKASSAEHREENLDVFDFELGTDDMDRLGALNEHYSSLSELPYV
jgi:2,5-diketo-D-gluconate reductase A